MSIAKELHLFQIITLGVFLFIGIVGIAFFATNKNNNANTGYEPVVWGTLPKSAIDDAMIPFRNQGINPRFSYVEYPEEGFEQNLLVAAADGQAPDAIIFPSYMLYSQSRRLVTIPSESFSAKSFLDTYVDGASIFAVQGGVKALPITVDPLMMYWNRDLFSSAGLLNPPKNWAELSQMVNKIAQKRDNGIIDRSFVALGEYENVAYAKRILFTLFSQVGVQLTYFSQNYGAYTSGLMTSVDDGGERSRSVLTYYTEFANPVKKAYTWNKSLKNSRDAFLAGDLAVYFGPASEIEFLRSQNPNLNFRVSPMPQENVSAKSVHGKIYALGFLATSKDINGSIAELTKYFVQPETIRSLALDLAVAPALRSVLASSREAVSDPDIGAVYESAVYAKDWIDPNPATTNVIFKNMIESITNGQQTLYESLQNASDRVSGLFQ